MTDINVKAPKTGKEASSTYEFGATLAESIKLFTEEVVHSIFVAQATVKAQGVMRSVLNTEAGTVEGAKAALSAWKPGVARTRAPVDHEAIVREQFKNMTADEKKAFIASLKA